jgi:hypothetical protein
MAEPTPYLLGLRASTADLLTELAGLQWSDVDVAAPSLCEGWTTDGDGPPVDVRGPDWAVAARLVGRPSTAADALTATPPLRPWR